MTMAVPMVMATDRIHNVLFYRCVPWFGASFSLLLCIAVLFVSTRDVNQAGAPAFPAALSTFIAAHELGHALGLDHNPLPDRLMTATLNQNQNLIYELDKHEWDVVNA